MQITIKDTRNQRTIEKKSNIIWFINVIIGTIVVYMAQMSYVLGQTSLLYISATIFLFFFIVANKTNKLMLMLFVLPSNGHLSFGDISIISLSSLVYFVEYIVFRKEKLRREFLFLGLMLLLYTQLFAFGNFNLAVRAIKIILFSFMIESIFDYDKDKAREKIKNGIIYLALGIIIESSITLLLNPNALLLRFSLIGDLAIIELGILCGIVVSFVLALFNDVYNKKKTFMIVMLILIISIGFATMSRTFVFMLLISVIGFLVFNLKNLKNGSKAFKLLLVLSLGFGLVFYFNKNVQDVLIDSIDRIINPLNNDISSNRFGIWSAYFDEFSNDIRLLLFGRGYSTSPKINSMPHNIFIEQITLFGIAGNIIIFLFIYSTIKELRARFKRQKNKLIYYLVIVNFSAALLFIHSFLGHANTIIFFMAIIIVWLFPDDNRKYIS